MVSEDCVLNEKIERTALRRHEYCYAVVYVYSGVPDSVKLFWDYKKARKYKNQLRREMYHPDYDETAIFRVEVPKST